MDFTVDWVFPVGLGILGSILALFNWETKAALVKIRKNKRRQKFFIFYIPVGQSMNSVLIPNCSARCFPTALTPPVSVA